MSNVFNNHYFYVNKFFLSCIGQWPFHNARRNLLIQCFIILHLFISFIPKATAFLKACGDLNQLTEGIPTIFLGISSLSFSIIFLFKQEKLNKLYREIKFDWECLSSSEEETILSKHANYGRLLTIFFTGFLIGALITYGLVSTIQIFNFLLSFNESQKSDITFQIYYSVNYSETYFYWIILHFSFNTILETAIFISFELVLAVSIEHACGSFEKIGLYIEKINFQENETENQRAVTYCVSQHNRAIEFCDSIEALYWPYFMCIVTLKKFFISVSFVQIFADSYGFLTFLKYGIFVGCSMIYLLCNTLFAGRLMDYSTSLADTVYNTLWYQMPLRIKKSLLLIMMRSRIPCKISTVCFIGPLQFITEEKKVLIFVTDTLYSISLYDGNIPYSFGLLREFFEQTPNIPSSPQKPEYITKEKLLPVLVCVLIGGYALATIAFLLEVLTAKLKRLFYKPKFRFVN